MKNNKIVGRDEWLAARKSHLEREKQFDRQRDKLSEERRQLPWVKVEDNYQFESADGQVSLARLFGDKTQLIVYHFMFHPDAEQGCPTCSFWIDNLAQGIIHLNNRDVSVAVISRTVVEKIDGSKARMDWNVRWVSSLNNTFNMDYHVSFTQEQVDSGRVMYNYKNQQFSGQEAPGVSVFFKSAAGEIFHTYSTYGRGLDKLNGVYHYLDIVPKGRDENSLPYKQAWLRHHGRYESH